VRVVFDLSRTANSKDFTRASRTRGTPVFGLKIQLGELKNEGRTLSIFSNEGEYPLKA
jgi:hypothetical protein